MGTTESKTANQDRPSDYDALYEGRNRERELQERGTLVIKFDANDFQISKNGREFFYLNPFTNPNQVLSDWLVAMKEVRQPSGRHTHQGGIVIFAVKGKGYINMNGERYDWKPGDLILLPFDKDGIEHQHFAADPDEPAMWIAFISQWLRTHVGTLLDQVEEYSEWTEAQSA